jgi:hypothetical protein
MPATLKHRRIGMTALTLTAPLNPAMMPRNVGRKLPHWLRCCKRRARKCGSLNRGSFHFLEMDNEALTGAVACPHGASD